MNREDIIRMAREAQLAYGSDENPLPSVKRFAALVAAAEREACAKVCEERGVDAFDNHDLIYDECAKLIRARSEK